AVAEEAGLHERYVREWLGAAAAGGNVEHDAAACRYHLPPEHAAVLTREARPKNPAPPAHCDPPPAPPEAAVGACFERGRGVPYSSFDRFRQVMAEESDQTVVAALRDSILPLVPGLCSSLEDGIDVLDVGCGSGRALNLLARGFPRSRFTG